MEWKEVFQALRSLNYDGWLTIEGFAFALPDLMRLRLYGETSNALRSPLLLTESVF